MSTANAATNGPLATLSREAIEKALAAKVTGPILLAGHFAESINGLHHNGQSWPLPAAHWLFLASVAAKNPARRVGSTADLTEAVMFALTNRNTTASVIHVDGGGRFA